MRRRPPFQPNAAIPMMRETYDRLSLELRIAGEELIARPSIDAYNKLSKMLAALAGGGMRGGAMELGTSTLNAICDRFAASQAITVSEAEAEHLRAAILSIEAGLPQLPVNRFRQAVAQVEIWCAIVGLGEQQNNDNDTATTARPTSKHHQDATTTQGRPA